jgi:diacylglycerol kinase (ATP)
MADRDVSEGPVSGTGRGNRPPPLPSPRVPGAGGNWRIFRSFGFAFAGLGYLLRTQRNSRVEVVIGAGACGVGWWVGIGRVEWAILAMTIAIVLILEGVNTAIEAAIDLAMPNVHPLAKTAKDVAAGMVLIASIMAIVVGLLILGPGVWNRLVK